MANINAFPYWYRLIHAWVHIKNRTGLSFPFLVGGMGRNLGRQPKVEDIGDLIYEMSHSSFPEVVIIRQCDNLNEPVAGLVDRRTKFSLGTFMSDNLYVSHNVHFTGQDIDDLSAHFEDLYTPQITNQTFSKSLNAPQNWGDYTNADEELLKFAHNYWPQYK